MITRPMLAAPCETAEELDKLKWPALCSRKLDGIRCLIHPTLGPVTRSFKSIPNEWLRKALWDEDLKYLDGEIITYKDVDCTEAEDFNTIQSRVMSGGGANFHFVFHAFDCFRCPEHFFRTRLEDVHKQLKNYWDRFPDTVCADIVWHADVTSLDEFVSLAACFCEEGYEGIMYRQPEGPYKSGRSTLKQGWLVKYKQFADAEGFVVDFEEMQRNINTLEADAFGLAKRAQKKEGLVSVGTLGALVLRTQWGELRIGSGFSLAQRDDIWARRGELLGKVCTFKYQTHGMKEVPRFPIFKGWRLD